MGGTPCNQSAICTPPSRNKQQTASRQLDPRTARVDPTCVVATELGVGLTTNYSAYPCRWGNL